MKVKRVHQVGRSCYTSSAVHKYGNLVLDKDNTAMCRQIKQQDHEWRGEAQTRGQLRVNSVDSANERSSWASVRENGWYCICEILQPSCSG